MVYHSQGIAYTIRRHRRARHLRLTVTRAAEVVLTVPRGVNQAVANDFLQHHIPWVQKKIAVAQTHQPLLGRLLGKHEVRHYQTEARALIAKTVHQLNKHYSFHVGKITIRNQSSRWGSCSKKGNLNFNFRLLFLEEKLLHYVVVHELCHLKELNHSGRFWQLVTETIPDYKERRQALRKIHW